MDVTIVIAAPLDWREHTAYRHSAVRGMRAWSSHRSVRRSGSSFDDVVSICDLARGCTGHPMELAPGRRGCLDSAMTLWSNRSSRANAADVGAGRATAGAAVRSRDRRDVGPQPQRRESRDRGAYREPARSTVPPTSGRLGVANAPHTQPTRVMVRHRDRSGHNNSIHATMVASVAADHGRPAYLPLGFSARGARQ